MYGRNKVGIIDNMTTISLHPVHSANGGTEWPLIQWPLHVIRANAGISKAKVNFRESENFSGWMQLAAQLSSNTTLGNRFRIVQGIPWHSDTRLFMSMLI